MRIWNRLKTVLPLILAASMSANAAAQGIPGVAGGGLSAQYAGNAGYSAIGYQGMSPSFLSHPYISPFDNAIEQHFSSDGLWFRDNVGHFEPRGRKYEYDFAVEWQRSKVRNFTEQVGDPNARTRVTENMGELVTEVVQVYRMFLPPLMGQLTSAEPHGMRLTGNVRSRDGWRASAFMFWNEDTAGRFSARADRDQFRKDEVDSLVYGLSGGVGNPGPVVGNSRDTTDLAIALDLLLLDPVTFDALDLEAIDMGLRGTMQDVLDRTLLSELSLPLQTGLPPDGDYQRFDIEFSVVHNVETYSTGAHFETAPVHEYNGIVFRGLVGGRYMRINEGFQFRGIDSGLAYEIDVPGNEFLVDRIDNDGDFFVDDIEEGGSGAGYDAFNTSDELLIRSFVDSQVESDLGGPEFGVSYDLGRRLGAYVTGSTRVGALLNNERLRMSGDNIGGFAATTDNLDDEDRYIIDPVTNENVLYGLFDTSTSDGTPTENFFRDSAGAMHVSPMFEQSLTANVPIFGQVPVLKDMHILQDANLQVGWTYVWIGEVAEPHGSIVWESNPREGVFPNYDVRRRAFSQHTFRLGVNCRY